MPSVVQTAVVKASKKTFHALAKAPNFVHLHTFFLSRPPLYGIMHSVI